MDYNDPKESFNIQPLSQILKKIRENKIISDSLSNTTKHIGMLKDHYGLEKTASD